MRVGRQDAAGDGGRGTPRQEGARPGLTPRGPRAPAPRRVGSCRRQLADRSGGSGAGRRGPRWPGRPHAPAPPSGRAGGRRRSRAPRGSRRALRSGLWAPAPGYFLSPSERGSRKRLALVVKGFLSKAFRRRLAARSPPGAHGNRRPRPRGRAWRGRCRAEAPGAGAPPGVPPRRGWGCPRGPEAPGEAGGKLGETAPTWRRVAWGGGRSRLLPATAADWQVGRPGAPRWALAGQGAPSRPGPAPEQTQSASSTPLTGGHASSSWMPPLTMSSLSYKAVSPPPPTKPGT